MKSDKSKGVLFAVFLLAQIVFLPVTVMAGSSGQLFTGGTIYVDADTKAGNIFIKDGLVAGLNVDPAQYIDAEIIDLKGAAAYPGFIDCHVHLMETGLALAAGSDLSGCTDADSIVKALAPKVKTLPPDGVVLGVGFAMRDYNKWTLNDLAKIDALTGSRPACLIDTLGHNAIINTAAIRLAGITPKTVVPTGGRIILQSGKLTGMLRESATLLVSDKIFSRIDDKSVKAGTLNLLKLWASMGYTGIVDLMGGPGFHVMRPWIFQEMETEGTLPVRVNYCYTIFKLDDVEMAAKYIGKDTDMVRFAGCKIFIDGAFAGGQAWTDWKNLQGGHGLNEVYTSDKGGPQLNLNRIVAKVEGYGMNMQYHAQGDKAIAAVLDALDNVVAKQGKLKGIHTIVHLAFPTDQEIERMKKFGGHVVAAVQPGLWPTESDTAHYYGSRSATVYPIRKIIDAGISTGISTDFSVSPLKYSPTTVIIGIALTGGGDPKNHPPLTIEQMVRGFTEGSAKTTGRDDEGTLNVGKKADIVVFEKDLSTVDAAQFGRDCPKVLATYVGGKKTYEAGK